MSGQHEKTHTLRHTLSDRDFVAHGAAGFGQVEWMGGPVEVQATDVVSLEEFTLSLQPNRCELVRDDSLRAGNSRLEFTCSVYLPGTNGKPVHCEVVLASDGCGWMNQTLRLA